MANKIKLDQREYGDEYEPSDSEDDYSEEERELLKNIRKVREKTDDEKEVMRFDSDEDEDEDFGNALDDSDVERPEDDNIPDSKSWGRNRANYYNTDFVDQDYSTYNEKEEELAKQEEEDAREIQQRLAKQLNDADFSLDLYAVPENEEEFEKIDEANLLKTDLSDLSTRQREQLFQKDSPEFAGLVSDFERHLKESEALLEPVIEYAAEQEINHLAIDFAKTFNRIIMSYCTNISFYLLLKARRTPVKNHPVVKRLVNFKQLIESLSEKYEKVVKPQLQVLLEAFESGVDVAECLNKPPKQKSRGVDYEEQLSEDEGLMEEENTIKSDGDEELEEEDDGRRAITYQIAKNKGLTPHRKKELRNPRVKHRGKYRKALIRRKGAVRTVRKEFKRYSGELSGIKATVKKGIKIKS